MTSLLLIEPHLEMRNTLSLWIAHHFPDIKVIDCSTSREALVILNQTSVNIILISVERSVAQCLEDVHSLMKVRSDAKCILLTTFDDTDYHLHAVEAGVMACVSKRNIHQELVALLQKEINLELNKTLWGE